VLWQEYMNVLMKNVKMKYEKNHYYYVYQNQGYLSGMFLQEIPISLCKINHDDKLNSVASIYYEIQRKSQSYILTNNKITKISHMRYKFFIYSDHDNELIDG
jgi:hypothetical protein